MTSPPAGEPGDDERPETDPDETWRQIVASYGERAELSPQDLEPEASRTERHDVDPDASADGLRRLFRDPLRPTPPDEPGALLDADEGFVPPEPPPVPRPTGLRGAAWVGTLGVPALLVVLLLLGMRPPSWVMGLLVAWFAGGFVYLVATMSRTDADGWDDGAVL